MLPASGPSFFFFFFLIFQVVLSCSWKDLLYDTFVLSKVLIKAIILIWVFFIEVLF